MLYAYLIVDRDTIPALTPTSLDYDWKSNLAHNVNDTEIRYDYSTMTTYKVPKNLIVLDEYNRILSVEEIEDGLNREELERRRDPLYNYALKLNLNHKIKRRQHRKSHTTFRPYAKHMTGYVNQRKMQIICEEFGIKYTPKFNNDTWDGMTMAESKSRHKSNHRNSTGWKSKKIKHQWQVHQR